MASYDKMLYVIGEHGGLVISVSGSGLTSE